MRVDAEGRRRETVAIDDPEVDERLVLDEPAFGVVDMKYHAIAVTLKRAIKRPAVFMRFAVDPVKGGQQQPLGDLPLFGRMDVVGGAQVVYRDHRDVWHVAAGQYLLLAQASVSWSEGQARCRL